MKADEFEKKGFIILKNVLDEKTILRLTEDLSKLKSSVAVKQRNGTKFGVRNLLYLSPAIKEFAGSKMVREVVDEILGKTARTVRAIYFDKTPEANWKVPWHQDLTIAVREKREAEGFSAWTTKAGIRHVQPPVKILEGILTLRFHLDDADETNGALKVLGGTHRKGRLSSGEIQYLKAEANTYLCNASKGDVLAMHPLLVHSSSAGSKPKNRRIIHLEFSADRLPGGLMWYGS